MAVAIAGSTRKLKTFKAFVKRLRTSKRFTQGEAAKAFGISIADIRTIESGKIGKNYCYDYLFALAHSRKRKSKRTGGGAKRAGNIKQARRRRR